MYTRQAAAAILDEAIQHLQEETFLFSMIRWINQGVTVDSFLEDAPGHAEIRQQIEQGNTCGTLCCIGGTIEMAANAFAETHVAEKVLLSFNADYDHDFFSELCYAGSYNEVSEPVFRTITREQAVVALTKVRAGCTIEQIWDHLPYQGLY